MTVSYEVAKPSDSGEVIRLLARVFSESEPPAVAMGLSMQEFKEFLEAIAPTILTEGLTFIARGVGTGTLAGVLLTDDFGNPPCIDPCRISSRFLPILAMLELLDEQFRKEVTMCRCRYLHLFMLAVDGQFAGRGIGQELIRRCIENGYRKGYQKALTEATGKISQHIFRKNGFMQRFSVPYGSFLYENRPVFASIQGHEGAMLMDKSIRPCSAIGSGATAYQ
jgi:ribosomal protein S18 acetylase RimI-like enzyme